MICSAVGDALLRIKIFFLKINLCKPDYFKVVKSKLFNNIKYCKF